MYSYSTIFHTYYISVQYKVPLSRFHGAVAICSAAFLFARRFSPPSICHRATHVTLCVATFVQTKYTVVNRDTGELYDVREIDTSMPYRYSVLPHNMRVPSKARQLLGINEQPTHVPPKAAKVTCGLLVYRLFCRTINSIVEGLKCKHT